MNVIQENPPIIRHPKFNEIMFPNNEYDEKHIQRIKEGYEKQNQHNINKLKVITSAIYNDGYDTKFLNPYFKGLFPNDPKYKIFSVPLP